MLVGCLPSAEKSVSLCVDVCACVSVLNAVFLCSLSRPDPVYVLSQTWRRQKNKTMKKTGILTGGVTNDPPGSSRNTHVKPSTVLTTGGGHQMTPPDRQAPTSYNKGSSRNKCFLTTGGGHQMTPPDRQDFAQSDICIIASNHK